MSRGFEHIQYKVDAPRYKLSLNQKVQPLPIAIFQVSSHK